MIAVKLMGGLGNQMFQYATGLALASRNDTTLKLDLSWFRGTRKLPDAPPREYELWRFSIRAGTYGRSQRLASLRYGSRLVEFAEKQHHFDPDVLTLPDNSYLTGYFQTEAYFLDVEPAVRHDLRLKRPPTGRNKALLAEIRRTNAVSLHVRRGDYVTDPDTQRYHGSASLDYYRAAVAHLAERVSALTLFVFSDAPDWCRANLDLGHPAVYVDANPPRRGYEDMRLMSSCRHHIIANSTFSWWGAWLNRDPEKIVIAPKRWFLEPGVDYSDVVPGGWVRL